MRIATTALLVSVAAVAGAATYWPDIAPKLAAFDRFVATRLQAQNESRPATKPPAKAETPPTKPTHTQAQWSAALRDTYIEQNLKDKGDGTSNSDACFDKTSTCADKLEVRRDTFRHLRRFSVPGVLSYSILRDKSGVAASIALRDCEKPHLVLNPVYFNKTYSSFSRPRWIFMNRLAVMVDGEVIIDIEFDRASRDNGSSYVLEDAYLPLLPPQLASIRKVINAQSMLVRLSGSEGYENLDKAEVARFQLTMRKLLFAFDALSKSTDGFEGCAG